MALKSTYLEFTNSFNSLAYAITSAGVIDFVGKGFLSSG